MTAASVPELPAEVLEHIFSLREPGHRPHEPEGPLLSAVERLRCQLVCRAWRHALDACRWPLYSLKVEVWGFEINSLARATVLWLLRVRPGMQRLEMELSGPGGYQYEWLPSVTCNSLAVKFAHRALLQLQPATLTSLRLHEPQKVANLCGGAMPALARLELHNASLRTSSDLAALQRLTALHLGLLWDSLEQGAGIVARMAPSLRSLSVCVPPLVQQLGQEAARAVAAAGASQLTCLKFTSTACLAHLPAWPHLQVLLLERVHPTSIKAEQQALLAAATSLRRLGFHYHIFGPIDQAAARQKELDRMEELRLALGCTQLDIEPSGPDGHQYDWLQPVTCDSLAAETTLNAVLHLQPASALRSLALSAPFPLLERFLPALGRFTGLRQLELRASLSVVDNHIVDGVVDWQEDAVLRPSLLRHLPPQLRSLTAANFYTVRLDGEAARVPVPAPALAAQAAAAAAAAGSNAAAAGSSAVPAQLPPGLTRLCNSGAYRVALDMPLPGLAELNVSFCHHASLAGERLRLPQLTSLQLLEPRREASVRGGAMPALARLELCSPSLSLSSGLATLASVTELRITVFWESLQRGVDLVASLSPSLRSLSVTCPPGYDELGQEAAHALAAAGASQLARLKFGSPACLAHLSAWPHLQELFLERVHPTSVTAEQLAQLAAATSLRRLVFEFYGAGSLDEAAAAVAQRKEADRMEELRLALGCMVEQYWGAND
ncbi:f-box leucine rich repeat [Chlorella sorokiniana]|uniref:F-box leucine rich repeat n=1 Tax=Chlorella sorokiniana TaxID=3076 RepID=A0A2P6TGQ5_CHLSO|nr:f-box leucine rich repeat [Chlorella sorokiniana]|eukprot:PRW33299.1 f-box leucine rich repeat [Chlorella sorokiniana]